MVLQKTLKEAYNAWQKQRRRLIGGVVVKAPDRQKGLLAGSSDVCVPYSVPPPLEHLPILVTLSLTSGFLSLT